MQPTELASTPVRRIVSALVLGVLVTAASLAVRAEETIRIVITESIEGAVPIAIVPFAWKGTGPAPARLAEIVADDLARTGRFEPIPFPDLPSRPAEPAEVNFSDWRLLGTGNLVIGNVTPKGPDRFSIEFRLFDVFRARQLTGFQIDSAGKDLRRVAHQVSDVVYEALTGERGAFDTRIAYVTETGAGDAKRYALNVADSDGFNAFTILETREPVLSPAWSPDGGRLAYVSYDGERPRIYVQDLASGKRDEVAGSAGINGAPAWSPDGRRLAMTLSKDGNPEIYLMDVTSRRLRRVTSNFAIDTEPTWSPDGQRLLFTSDRSGGPQLYEVDVGGGTPRRVTFDGRYNARGRYSPDGERIAFVHGKDGGFHVAVLERANDALRVLTETRLDESPSFAPNGSMILYATVDGGVSTLAAVSTDGRMRQQLGVQRGKVREPAWSPFRPR